MYPGRGAVTVPLAWTPWPDCGRIRPKAGNHSSVPTVMSATPARKAMRRAAAPRPPASRGEDATASGTHAVRTAGREGRVPRRACLLLDRCRQRRLTLPLLFRRRPRYCLEAVLVMSVAAGAAPARETAVGLKQRKGYLGTSVRQRQIFCGACCTKSPQRRETLPKPQSHPGEASGEASTSDNYLSTESPPFPEIKAVIACAEALKPFFRIPLAVRAAGREMTAAML